MKKLFILLIVLTSAKAFGQYTNGVQYLGNDSNVVMTKGGFMGRLINRVYTDTTAANLQHIKEYPGAQLFTTSDDKFWLRNATATAWIGVSGSGGSQTWESTLQAQGSTPFTTDNAVDFGSRNYTQFNLDNYEINGNYLGIYAPYADLQVHDTTTQLSARSVDGLRGSQISVSPDTIEFIGTTQQVKIRASIDSSDADPNNIAWFDSNDILHRGAFSGVGGAASRFGIEDNLGVQDRLNNMQNHAFEIDSLGTFDVYSGDMSFVGNVSNISMSPTTAYLFNQTSVSDVVNITVGGNAATMAATNGATGASILVKTNGGIELIADSIKYLNGAVTQIFSKPPAGNYFIPLTVSGNAADATGNIPLRYKGYTVATLPAGTVGDVAFVTDATAPTYLGALTGGGAVTCPVFFNGTIWVSH